MAAQIRTVDFLPEIFQTPVNKQFLAATLDQLVQNPQFKQTQGYIGQKVGPGVNATDKYVIEPTAIRNESISLLLLTTAFSPLATEVPFLAYALAGLFSIAMINDLFRQLFSLRLG